jgi:serine/threonine protein kinase/WD40 repeat protein
MSFDDGQINGAAAPAAAMAENGSAAEASVSAPAAADPRLADAVEQYRAALRAGQRPDPREYCARYSDLAGPLAECLDALDFLHAAAPGLTNPGPAQEEAMAWSGELRAGKLLGDFRILREVGRGGMAVVYAAEQVSLRRLVALKVLPFACVTDSRRLQRFQNEARAAACLHHPNIVPVHAVGCEDGVHFYAMQLIEGQTGAGLIRNLRRLAERGRRAADDWLRVEDSWGDTTIKPGQAGPHRADSAPTKPAAATHRFHLAACSHQGPPFARPVAQLGVQAALALEHAHQQGIVHRDIKPANLLIESTAFASEHSALTTHHSPRLWITDFGLAHLQGDTALTASGDLVGTLRYMSPEQAQAGRAVIDHRTDIYSLGATLYEFLALTPAFAGDDPRDLIRRICEEEPPALRRLDPAIPADLEVIVLKAMAKEPSERYARAQEMADDLRRFLDDRPILARRPTRAQRARRWARKHRPLVASIAAAAALLVVGLVLCLVAYTYELKNISAEQEKINKRARADLYRALLSDSYALRLAHQPGYRAAVWNNLRRAASLDVTEKDVDAIAAAALACLGDPIGLDPVEAPAIPHMARPILPEGFDDTLRSTLTELKRFGWNISPDWIKRKAASRDGKLVAVLYSDRVLLFGKATDFADVAWGARGGPGRLLPGASHVLLGQMESPFGAIYDAAFDQEGKRLVVGCEGGFRVWEMPRPGQQPIPGGPVRGTVGSGNIHSVALHPQGWLVAAAGQHIELWSCPHGRLIATLPIPSAATEVAFSADGQLLLAIVDGEAILGWPVADTPEKRRLHGHEGAGVPSVAFSPDGQLLASASKDRTVKVWDAGTGQLLHTLAGHTAAIEGVAFSPDGRLLASGDFQGAIYLWDAVSGRKLFSLREADKPPGQVWRIQFDREGKSLAAAGGKGVAVWSIDRRQGGVVFLTLREDIRAAGVYDLAFHPSGQSFAYLVLTQAEHSSQLLRYDLGQQEKPRRLGVAVQNQIRGLNFDPSGRRLRFVTPAGKLGCWDWDQNAAVPGPGLGALQWAPAPGGRWVATANSDRAVVIYDLDAGVPVLTLPPEESDVWTLAWAPDCRRLAVGTSDGAVSVWDLEQVRAALAELGIHKPAIAVGAGEAR